MNKTDIMQKINEAPLLAAYFSYPECSVCRVLRPKVEELISGHPGAEFLYVNTHEQTEISGQFLVFTVPTIIIFSGGREQKRFSRHFSLLDLQGYLERVLALES